MPQCSPRTSAPGTNLGGSTGETSWQGSLQGALESTDWGWHRPSLRQHLPHPQLSDSKDAFKKTWNPKFTLRSHYDGIRALAFHHSQSALLTASEDGTLKLWNLQKAAAAKK